MRFTDYINIRETSEEPMRNDITLGKNNDFKPFIVDKYNNVNLRPLIKAFSNSGNVEIKTSTGDVLISKDSKGHHVPQRLKPKSLYLVGGAVRDYLNGKTPKDYDLATDATVPEIKMILNNAGFEETKAMSGKHNQDDSPMAKSKSNKVYYVKGWDREGNAFVVGAKVNGQEFEIATFRKDSKSGDGRTPDKMEPGTLEDDALRRDLTINSMYIKLNNSNGANNKLIDMWGGARHLKNKQVRFVGNVDERLEEDQLRALRYIRFLARFGNTKEKLPTEYVSAIRKLAKDGLPAVSPERIRDEFLKGLENPDVNPKEYIRLYKELDLLPRVFPNVSFQLNVPEDYLDEKDKHIAIAWILRNNPTDKIDAILRGGKWENSEIKKIKFLIDIMKSNPSEMDADKLHKIYHQYNISGLSSSALKKWWDIHKMPHKHLNAFMDFNAAPRIAAMIKTPTGEKPHPDFADLFNPVTNAPLYGTEKDIGLRKKSMEFNNYNNILKKYEI